MHLICDNYGTHKSPSVVNWLQAHPRFHMQKTILAALKLGEPARFFDFNRHARAMFPIAGGAGGDS